MRALTVALFGCLVVLPPALQAQSPADSTRGGRRALTTTESKAPIGVAALSIDSTAIMASVGESLSEALQAQLPGLSVLRSDGSAASGSRVRLRGLNSLLASTAPIVIVDGVRVDARQDATVFDIGVYTSRLDDIARQDVARVDVYSGPAAASLFGPGAANGALVITTKRGGPGALSWRARAESRIKMVPTKFPANYHMTGIATATGQPTNDCGIARVASGACTPQRLDSWTPLVEASPFKTGRAGAGSAAVSGDLAGVAAYVGASGERTLGLSGDDDLGRLSLRGNAQHRVGDVLGVTVHGGYTRTSAGLPLRGMYPGVLNNGMLGAATDDANRGYRPSLVASSDARERATHWLTGVALDYRFRSWLDAALTWGLDQVDQRERWTATLTTVPGSSTSTAKSDQTTRTLSASITARHDIWPANRLDGRASIGYDRWSSHFSFDRETAFLSGRSRSGGPWLREAINWGNHVDIEGALRWESDDLFGDAGPRLFRSGSASWLVGDAGALHRIRLRAAYGEGSSWLGNDPSLGSVIAFSTGGAEADGERVSELEGGVDANAGNRVKLSLTAFRVTASRLFIMMIAAPSTGGGSGLVPVAAGALRNVGLEFLTEARLLESERLQWDATLAFSALRNRTTSIGRRTAISGGGARTQVGSPVASYVTREFRYADANHDGVIAMSEIQLGDTGVVLGSSLPTREAALRSRMSFGRRLSLDAVLDYRGGHMLENRSELLRCEFGICRGAQDPSAPLDDQARALLSMTTGVSSFVEHADFVKLREVSLRWTLPGSWSSRIGTGYASISVAGRNLATWTRYNGLDPETSLGRIDELPRVEFFQLPTTRQFILRLDVAAR